MLHLRWSLLSCLLASNATPRNAKEIAWSPDSRAIAFTRMPSPGADDWPKADLAEVDVASGTAKPIAATNAAEAHPVYSPDGKLLAFRRRSRRPAPRQPR